MSVVNDFPIKETYQDIEERIAGRNRMNAIRLRRDLVFEGIPMNTTIRSICFAKVAIGRSFGHKI
jgi:hypothetical protein